MYRGRFIKVIKETEPGKIEATLEHNPDCKMIGNFKEIKSGASCDAVLDEMVQEMNDAISARPGRVLHAEIIDRSANPGIGPDNGDNPPTIGWKVLFITTEDDA